MIVPDAHAEDVLAAGQPIGEPGKSDGRCAASLGADEEIDAISSSLIDLAGRARELLLRVEVDPEDAPERYRVRTARQFVRRVEGIVGELEAVAIDEIGAQARHTSP